MRKITKIIIHCSATPEGREVSKETITKWHIERGFSTIGYHFLIHLDGSVEKGRDINQIGAHCSGQNAESIGICYIGGCDKDMKSKDTRTDAQKVSLRNLIRDLKISFPNAIVYGHNEFSSKDCPCFDVKSEFREE